MVLLPKVTSGIIAPWMVIVVVALVALPLALLDKPAMARWFLRYQYYGHAI
jgi:hypothetical protein